MRSVYLYIAVPILLQYSAIAQTSVEHHGASHIKPQIHELADGEKNPGGIPDLTAYHHFFTVLRHVPGISAADNERRRQSYLKTYFQPSCGPNQAVESRLSDAQVQRLLTLADSLSVKLQSIQSEITSLKSVTLDPSQTPAYVELVRKRDTALADAVASIPSSIGSDVAEKVQRHIVQHVKPRIKLVHVEVSK